jgi:hypothetical protein
MVGVTLGCGSTYQGTANAWGSAEYYGVSGAVNLIGTLNATMYLSDVQLEVGELATDFERLPVDEVLRRCQRYYEKSYDLETVPGTATTVGIWQGASFSGGDPGAMSIFFLTRKRTTPQISAWDDAGNSGKFGNRYSGTWHSNIGDFSTVSIGTHGFVGESGSTSSGNIAIQWTADAEL